MIPVGNAKASVSTKVYHWTNIGMYVTDGLKLWVDISEASRPVDLALVNLTMIG